ncbi:uncharacterized protein LOC133197529 [Saccostrea echinata]|uniref:uncharacterized protein LOC133197529 n=1 Tax=Saccostrea echinata TaxID=191078 RepID=UPI002A80055A|nr:uncharacterized protein LOC133197529 [Saccostrea echinata]
MVIWIKLWGILLVLHEGFCIDQPYRKVQDTTCLEIVKLPNYQNRLTCTDQNEQYHCLLNGNYTTEYEVCREWKWIPKGKCAYFNTYGSGNVDERDCDSTSGLTCAPSEYNSADNARYAACYVKKEMTTMSILQTSTRQNVSTSDGGNSTSSNSTGSIDRTGQDGGLFSKIL